MTQKTITGTTRECLLHYVKTHGDKGKANVSRFSEANLHTIRRWLREERLKARGSYFMRLRYFLDAVGYEVVELKSLEDTVYNFFKLMAHHAITLEHALKETGYNNIQEMYRVAFGKCKVLQERREKIKAINSTYKLELEQKLSEFAKLYGAGSLPEKSAHTSTDGGKENAKEENAVQLKSRLPDEISHRSHPQKKPEGLLFEANLSRHLVVLLKAAVPLAEELTSDRFTAEDRARFRNMFQCGGIHQLYELLGMLLSEQSRKNIMAVIEKLPKKPKN